MNKIYSIIILLLLLNILSCVTSSNNYENNIKEEVINGSFDAIIVPGIPFKKPNWDKAMKNRVYWAYYLYKKKITKNIIFSGSAVYTPYVESKIMRLYAIKLGVDSNHIFTETRAQHSTENVYYSNMIADSLGFKRVALASDPFQAELLKYFIKKELPNIRCLPASKRIIDSIPKINLQINYKRAFVKDFTSIIEKQTKLERLRGTLGKNIEDNN